jgi:hypothetical protein
MGLHGELSLLEIFPTTNNNKIIISFYTKFYAITSRDNVQEQIYWQHTWYVVALI